MKNIKLLLEISSKMLFIAKDRVWNDLDKEIWQLIPEEWCEEARQMNSQGRDPWPETPQQFHENGLMWFLASKLEKISTELDRDIKLNDLGL